MKLFKLNLERRTPIPTETATGGSNDHINNTITNFFVDSLTIKKYQTLII